MNTTALLGLLVLVFFYVCLSQSCGRKKTDALKGEEDSISYVVYTRDVTTLISDSGITRYKLKAAHWYIYDQPEAKWYFPGGIELEQFDTLFHTEASVVADTAIYYQDDKLWELIGNVKILNRAGEKFFTSRLFWDQEEGRIYSQEASEIHLGTGRVIRPHHGFSSNQEMSKWTLYHTDAEMPVSEDGSLSAADSSSISPADADSLSIPSDTVAAASRALPSADRVKQRTRQPDSLRLPSQKGSPTQSSAQKRPQQSSRASTAQMKHPLPPTKR